MFRGYTYTLKQNLYCCSTKVQCRAKLKIDKISKELIVVNEKHIHPPPNYLKTATGKYIKIQVCRFTHKVQSLSTKVSQPQRFIILRFNVLLIQNKQPLKCGFLNIIVLNYSICPLSKFFSLKPAWVSQNYNYVTKKLII